MVRLYGNIKDWDLEHEYEVVRQNVAHTEALRAEQGTAPWTEIFRGSNGSVLDDVIVPKTLQSESF